MSNNRVYVGNLAYSVNNVDLKDFMSEAGNVVRANILFNAARQSRGCGIVEFTTAEEAQNAIKTLHNVELKGRLVFIREDREPPRGAGKFSAPPAKADAAGSAAASTETAATDGTAYASPASNTAAAAAAGASTSAATESTESSSESPARTQQSEQTQTQSQLQLRQRAVFVSNLPFSVTWYELKDLFAAAGDVVRADVHMLHHRSKGHGTVLFADAAGAESAIQRFNNYVLEGRTLEVRLDVPLSQRPGAFLWCSGFGEPSETVFASNLPWSTTDADLFDLFQSIAPLSRAQLQTFPDGRPSGNGVVKFENASSAALAVEQLDGYLYGSRPLHVSYARYQQGPHA